MATSVWLVSLGEKYEGGEVYGVFSTYEKARKYVDWYIEDDKKRYRETKWEEYQDGRIWTSGCEILSIDKHVIDDEDYYPPSSKETK